MSLRKLAGKTALITGASKGIGRATALALARQGANIIVNYNSDASAAEAVVSEIHALSSDKAATAQQQQQQQQAVAIQADISDIGPDGCKKLVGQSVERFGKIDILVLNAGLLMQNGGLDDVQEADFDRIYSTNVKGPFFLLKEAVPHISDNGGRILLFSTSLTAFSSITPNYLLYVSSKGAIEQMTRVLAKDLGKRGITVNTISPGPTGTDAFYVGKTEKILEGLKGANPMGRIGQPEEIADVVVFVAGGESSWMTGQNFRINGGMAV